MYLVYYLILLQFNCFFQLIFLSSFFCCTIGQLVYFNTRFDLELDFDLNRLILVLFSTHFVSFRSFYAILLVFFKGFEDALFFIFCEPTHRRDWTGNWCWTECGSW